LRAFSLVIPNFGVEVWSAKNKKLLAINGAPPMVERLKQYSKLHIKGKQKKNMKEKKKKT